MNLRTLKKKKSCSNMTSLSTHDYFLKNMKKPSAVLALTVGLSAMTAAQMVGPGGMTTYGGGGRRHGGTVRVRDPGKGFFIAGSTLSEMNGVYVMSDQLPAAIMAAHNVSLAYENRVTGWAMVLADAQQDKSWRAYGDGKSEWCAQQGYSIGALGGALLEPLRVCECV
jgi:hypothetical protein